MADLVDHPIPRWATYGFSVSAMLAAIAFTGLLAAIMLVGLILADPIILGVSWLSQRVWRNPTYAQAS